MRQEVVAIRNGLPPPQRKPWQRLADNQVQVGIHLKERFAIAVYRRDGDPAHPFISGLNFRTQVRHLRRDGRPERMPLRMAKHIAKEIVPISGWRQTAAEGINRGQLHVVIKLFAKCGARSPTAGGPAIVSKAGGKIILKIVSCRQIAAAAEDRHMAIDVVETRDLDLPAGADFSLRRHFFV